MKKIRLEFPKDDEVVVAPAVFCVPVSVEVPPGTDPILPSLPNFPVRGAQLSTQLINQNLLCWGESALKISSFER